jgi:ribonuclease T1
MIQNSSGKSFNKKFAAGGLIGLLLLTLLLFLGACGSGSGADNASDKAGESIDAVAGQQEEQPQPTEVPSVGPVSGLPVILWDELPPEAQETIQLIDQGGPFPYDKDGSTFGNREEVLPDRPHGYYKEYTVITPGSSNRGARRIVGGADGELYYTDDHYDSFREVVR